MTPRGKCDHAYEPYSQICSSKYQCTVGFISIIEMSCDDSHSSRYHAGTQPSTQAHIPGSALPLPPYNSHARQVTGTPQYRGRPLDMVHADVQREQDVHTIDQWITSSLWLDANAKEPVVGSQDSSRLVDQYGVRGLSCYSALVERRDDGSFGCRQERCMHFSARTMEGAITHQRANHYDHRPYKCSDVTGLRW